MRLHIEYTDTFGGDANYSWVYRHSATLPDDTSDLALVRYAKKHLGISGVRCDRKSWFDLIELRPRGMCTVLFLTFGGDE